MRLYVLSVFILSLGTNSAFAETKGRVTHPLPGDPLIDFRIDECEATKGFGSIWYFTESGPAFGLSDLCIDEEKGRVTSIETRDGFTLVEKSRNGKRLEVVGSSATQSFRTHVRFTRGDCVEDDPDSVFDTYHGFLYDDHFSIPDTRSAVMLGYTIPSLSNKPKKSVTEQIPMTLILFSQAQLPHQTTQVLPEVGQFRGELSVSGNTGVFSISEGAGTSVGEAGGTINLKFGADGEVLMSGQLTAKNQRLAGHKPGEWTTMTAEIAYMRGHLLGAEGDQINAFGVARGSFVDIDGKSHQFRAQLRFVSCLY